MRCSPIQLITRFWSAHHCEAISVCSDLSTDLRQSLWSLSPGGNAGDDFDGGPAFCGNIFASKFFQIEKSIGVLAEKYIMMRDMNEREEHCFAKL